MDKDLLELLMSTDIRKWEIIEKDKKYSLVLWDTEDECKFNLEKSEAGIVLYIYDDIYNTWEYVPNCDLSQAELTELFVKCQGIEENETIEENEELPGKRHVNSLIANTKNKKPKGWEEEEAKKKGKSNKKEEEEETF